MSEVTIYQTHKNLENKQHSYIFRELINNRGICLKIYQNSLIYNKFW